MKTLRVICALVLTGGLANAQSVWTGANFATDVNWPDAANWTGGAPGTSSTVTFNDGGFPLTTNAQGVVNNIVTANTTIASLTYNNLASSSDYVTTEIPAGTTLTISGTGAPSTGALSVGASDAASAIYNVVTITGGGSLYAGVNGTSLFSVQSGTGSGTASLLDLSGLTNFVFNPGGTSPGSFNLGTGGSGSAASVDLAEVSNNITASTLSIGDNNTRGANVLNLGNGTNIINADTINLGVSKTSGIMQFRNNGAGGLTIANHTGTGRATINLGTEASSGSTSAEATGDMYFNGGTVNILAGTMTVANRANRADSPGALGELSFNSGTVDATTILMAVNIGGGGSAFATISVGNSGVLKIGSGGLSLVSQGGTAGAGTLIITNGGTVICSNNIYNSTGVGTNTITISGGSLTMASLGGTIGVSNGIPLENFNITNATLTLPMIGAGQPEIAVTTFNPDVANTINIGSLPSITIYPAQFPIISYVAPAGGNLGTFTLGTLPTGFHGYISNNVGNASIDLVLPTGPAAKADLWSGAVNTSWDITTLNWLNSGMVTNYLDLDFVMFDDSAHTGTVNLTGTRSPATLTFNNNATNYALTGIGKISGPVQLVMNGSAAVTLSETGGDNFSAGMAVNSGTVVLDDAKGAISGGLTIGYGATMQIGNGDTNGALPSGPLDVEGTLVFDQTGNTTVATAIPGGGGLTQDGSGTLTLSAANSYTAATTVTSGTLALTGSGAIATSSSVTVNNATLDVSGATAATVLSSVSLDNATLNVEVGYLETNLTMSSLALSGTGNTINVRSLPPIASYPATVSLLYASGGITGYNFVLGTLPTASTAYAGSMAESADQSSVLLTLTAGPIGVRPAVTWSGVDAINDVSTNWTDAQNWLTPGVPAPTEKVSFNDTAAVGGIPFNGPGNANGGIVNPNFINNIVNASLTNATLTYANGVGGAQNTLIAPGKTLTVNGALTVSGIGGSVSILGTGGTLQLNNPGNATTLDVENGTAPTLDLSGLDTFNASVSQMGIGYDITSSGSSVSGVWYLARTNRITTGAGSVGNGAALVVGGSASDNSVSSGQLYLGQTNALYVDGITLGSGETAAALITFNPALTNNPVAYIRGITGDSSRVTLWSLGDDSVNLNNGRSGNGYTVDFTPGILNALVNKLVVGQGSQGNEVNTGLRGIFNMGAGKLDVTTLDIGVSGSEVGGGGSGEMNVTNGTVIADSVGLALAGGGGTNTSGTLNLTNSTLVVSNGITIGTGTAGGFLSLSSSTVELLGGTIGSPAAPLTNLDLDGGTLELNVNGNDSVTDIVATAVSTGATTTINIGNVVNVSGSAQVPLISYTGTDPFSALSLGTYPAGYNATLVDDTVNSSIDLSIASLVKPKPHFTGVSVSGTTLTLSATNGAANGQFVLLGTTNLTKPLSQWIPVLTNNFNASGDLNLSTNIVNPAIRQQFYMLSQ